MSLSLGSVVEGKVTGITKFGAFIALPESKSGMVHISEVARAYVNDIREHLTEGQTVMVKIISVDDAGRINLSIKRALEPQPQPRRTSPSGGYYERRQSRETSAPKELSFEDKLKQFMQDSESRMVDIKHQSDRKSGRRRSR